MFNQKQKKLDKNYEKAIKLYEKNPERGMDKMQQLCDKGSAKAALFLRSCILGSMKTLTSEQEKAKCSSAANNLLKKAADYGDVECQYAVAWQYERGDGFPKDEQTAFQYYLLAAKSGYAKAQTNLSRCYSLGIGVEHDAGEAMYWNQQAASQGESIAMINLANSYENGKGAPKDNQQAIMWYTRALETARYLLETKKDGMPGFSEKNEKNAVDLAQKGLRRMEIQIACEEYRDIQNEYLKERALKKILAFAEEDEWRAQYEMGLICEKANDIAGALKWYERASKNGSSGAMRNIGMLCYYGKGVEQNYELAYQWFKAAVDYAANTHAMYLLGEMYEKGLYVRQDREQAISWYQKADMQGSPEARERLKHM